MENDGRAHESELRRNTYKVGDPLLLIAKRIDYSSGGKRILYLENPEDENTKFVAHAYDFQTEWENPYENGGRSALCVVERYYDNTNTCMVSQCFGPILKELYPRTSLPKSSAFKVLYGKEDPTTHNPFYQLKDAFGLQHRFYTDSDLEIGAEVKLKVVDVVDTGYGKGYLRFALPGAESQQTAATIIDVNEESDFGFENETTEFKSSIVFVPSSSQPDIDEQLKAITNTIACFLNRNGGTIYLGVNDSGNVCGIEKDLPYLNGSKHDNFEYKNNQDSYQLKIQNTIRRTLGTNSVMHYIKISFDQKRDLTYCVIKVEPCDFPVFVNGIKLYQRMGNQTNLLRGEEITNFYRQKYKIKIDPLVTESVTDDDGVSAPETSEPILKMEQELKSVQPSYHLPKEEFTPWRYLRLYEDGRWSWGRNPARDRTQLIREVMIPKERRKNDCVLLMCYGTGRIDSVRIGDVIPNQDNRIYANGWRPEDNLLMVIAAHPNEMIAFRSVDSTGEEYNKIHRAGVFGQHQNLGGQGNIVVNDKIGGRITGVAVVPSSVSIQLDGYRTNRIPSQFLGYPRSDENRRNTLPLLDAVFSTGNQKD